MLGRVYVAFCITILRLTEFTNLMKYHIFHTGENMLIYYFT